MKKYIVLDCEACPIDRTIEGVDPFNMLAYDLGFAVVDKNGVEYEKRSLVIREIFEGETDKMQSAYYSWKLPKYNEELANGSRSMVSLWTARKSLAKMCKKWGVTEIYAHNMRFDFNTLNNTMNWVSDGKYNYFFPKSVKICDTLKLTKQLIAPMKSYKKFCEVNNFKTPKGQSKTTAEVIYKFISKDLDFVEAHTGLEDVLIEKEILRYCFSKHKKMTRGLFEK